MCLNASICIKNANKNTCLPMISGKTQEMLVAGAASEDSCGAWGHQCKEDASLCTSWDVLNPVL